LEKCPIKAKELAELAGDPRFISGIYNYCDRWCERCNFTSRCLVYEQLPESSKSDDPAAHDLNGLFPHTPVGFARAINKSETSGYHSPVCSNS